MKKKTWLCHMLICILVILGILAALLTGRSFQEIIIGLLVISLVYLFPKGGIPK